MGTLNWSNYCTTLDSLSRDRYFGKVTGTINEDPYLIPYESLLHDDWPELTFADMFNYLVCGISAYTSNELKCYKSMDAYKFFIDGWVQYILGPKGLGIIWL